ncbi:hypothetical protein BAOM_2987 [Peribacillus asahii]|uniref:Uncharacterized protein n=1 Tax=Peribacillus asahii TaxID=228899 RepID=A0A3Q9RK60_9BACI|nr:hypothetical protein [Peribacillus asahii]AZV43596.1 hypothetical protein BAOM_2987 [Peribacillus asahii]
MKGDLFINKDQVISATLSAPVAPTIFFKGKEDIEILRLEPNGDIFIRGRLVENDKQITDGLRQFLLSHGY